MLVPVQPFESVAVTTMGNEPVCVGVPASVPFAASVIPVGSVLEVVKNLDPRCGLCIDVGHTARTGVDVVESIRAAGPRLLDMHIKDLSDLKAKGSQVPVGDGAMPIVAIFKELKKMNYQGGVMLEYEVEADNPLPGMQKSFSYMRGVLAGLRG